MSEVADSPTETCYGCIHQRYRGSSSVGERMDLMGGTVIPIRENDRLDPGRYRCAKFDAIIGPADQTPEPLEDDCKERR